MKKIVFFHLLLLTVATSGFTLFAQTSFFYSGQNLVSSTKNWIDETSYWLKLQYPELQQPNTDLIVVYTRKTHITRHVLFQQTLQGLFIHGADAKVNLTQSGAVLSVSSNLKKYPGNIQGNFSLTEEQLRTTYEPSFGKIISSKKCLFLTSMNLRYAYELVIETPQRKSYRLTIDAENGQELDKEALFSQRASSSSKLCDIDTSGNGMVFNPDPLTSAEVPYGGAYVDNNDADDDALTNQRFSKSLKDIYFNPSTHLFYLQGPYVSIQDLAAPTTAPATSSDGNFNFTRSQSGFEDVNAYYHISTWQNRVHALGFDDLYIPGIPVDPHGETEDNSYFNETPAYILLGIGGIDDAEDADVLIHEYNHSVSSAAAPGSNSGFERKSLDEGMADYFAASYSRAIDDYNWEKVFSWDGNTSDWQGRTVQTTDDYNTASATQNIYMLGQVWSTCMMDLWKIAGANATDRLQLHELYFNAQNMKMEDAAKHLLTVDSLLYNNVHRDAMLEIFCDKKILSSSFCNANRKTNAPLAVYPNPISDNTLTLNGFSYAKSYTLDVYNLLDGKLMLETTVDNGTNTIDWGSLLGGMYCIKIKDGDATIHSQKMLLLR